MPTRIVMVEFVPGILQEEVEQFKHLLATLAERTSGLLRMTCGSHYSVDTEGALAANAPSVVFPHFASIWEFADAQALENFVFEPLHRQMAGERFRSLVARRYVINIP